MKRRVVLSACAGLALLLVLAAWKVHDRGLGRVLMGLSLFRGFEQAANFSRAACLFPASSMTPSSEPYELPVGDPISLPQSFVYGERRIEVESFLAQTDTGALLVLSDGKLRYERYDRTGGREVPWLSWSVAKSFVSALVGIAVAEGHIESIEEPVGKYVPALARSAYAAVRIEDVLQMSSGVAWDETYANPFSDVNRFGTVLFLGGSLNAFVAKLERDAAPGTKNRYSSADTHVLGMLIAAATGRSLSDYMQDKLWHPLGMEASGRWLLDDEGVEMAFGGLNATARDYAKLGELYRLRGQLRGRQIVPAAWVDASTRPDAPHLTAAAKANEPFPVGYGYQWWIPAGDEGEYLAIGIYNQFIYVNPTHGVVIVKLSAFSDYALGLDEDAYRELQTIELFRAIVRCCIDPVGASCAPACTAGACGRG